jgi:hypothetical protein
MSASITTLQTAIKATIETAAAANTFALPMRVHVDDSLATPPPTPDEPMDVQISYVASTTLARSSTRALDQFIVNVALSYRHPDGNQARLNDCHLIAEQLRDILAEFDADGQRVEQLLTPSPFDQAAALQGTYQYTLGLDCDVLRALHTSSAPTVSDSPRLSAIRGAVWDSIDNWSPFEDVWTRKFKTSGDVEELALHDPGLADLPAIAVSWGNVGQNWWTHREQKWPASLNVVFWLPADQIEIAEWRSQQIVECLYRATATPGGLTYLRAATGYPPEKYSQTIEPVVLGRGQNKALRGTIAFALPATFKPYD